jgi:hypothetical protein
MALRLRTSKPTVSSAGNELASSLGDLAGAGGRWLARQPVAHQMPAYATRVRDATAGTVGAAGAWAGTTASRARQRSADAASATKTRVVNLAIVAVLAWWLDRMLTSEVE